MLYITIQKPLWLLMLKYKPMFQRLRRLKLPFLPKKLTVIPLEDLIVEALDEAKNYSLIQDNDDLIDLLKNKFKLSNGTQLPPKEFIAKIINHIEKSPPQSPEEFAVFVRTTLKAIPAPVASKKKRFWKRS
jgi:hypothetical protein